MAGHAHPDLQAACQDGVALLDKLTSVCQQKYGACGPLSSYYLSNCNSVIFTWSHKGGEAAHLPAGCRALAGPAGEARGCPASCCSWVQVQEGRTC